MTMSSFMYDIQLVRDVFATGEVAGFTPELWEKLKGSPDLFRAVAVLVKSSGDKGTSSGEQSASKELTPAT